VALEDYLEPEVVVTAAVTTAVFSPKVRRLLRRGLVYGVAGVLTVGDGLMALSPGIGQSMRETMAAARHAARRSMAQAKAGFAAAMEKDTPNRAVQDRFHTDGMDQGMPSPEGQLS
jgi:hypothetical protein